MNKNKETTFTKNEIVQSLSKNYGISLPLSRQVVNHVFDQIVEALGKEMHCEFRDFGVFSISKRKPRMGRNPQCPGSRIQIPGRNAVRFKAGRKLRELTNKEAAPTTQENHAE